MALVSVHSNRFVDRLSLDRQQGRRTAVGRRRVLGRRHPAIAEHGRVLPRLGIVREISRALQRLEFVLSRRYIRREAAVFRGTHERRLKSFTGITTIDSALSKTDNELH